MKRFARIDLSQPIRILLIGCGYWGRNYVRIFNELSDASVVTVCDGSLDRLDAIGAAYPHLDLVLTLDDALADPSRYDAAVVCTPAAAHFDVAAQCLEAGLSVLVEKPMTTTARDADRLLALADAAGVTLMVGHTFLFNTGIAKVKQYVDEGAVGQIYHVYAQRTSLGPIRQDVDALWDLAPHDISIFNHLLGAEPRWASAVASYALDPQHADAGFISLGYPGGVVGHVHVSWADPHKVREVVLVGSHKRVVFDDTNALERVRVFDKGVCVESETSTTYGEFKFLLRDGDISSPLVESGEPLKAECAHFLSCLRSGEQPLSDGHIGRSVVAVMEAIDASVARGGAPYPVEAPAPAGAVAVA